MKTGTSDKAYNFNKPAYVVFVMVAIAFLLLGKISDAAMYTGLALIFDPFDINRPFGKRPLYQKIWLFTHVAVGISLFIWMLLNK